MTSYLSHLSVVQALAFSRQPPEGRIAPSEEDARRFIAWHSRGATLDPLTPGLLRLVIGFKAMGQCLAPETDSNSWAHGFKHGLLFLDDFMDQDTPDLQRVMAFRCYRATFGAIPSRYSKVLV